MTPSRHGRYGVGYIRATKDNTKIYIINFKLYNNKIIFNSDYFLKFENMKLESRVIVDNYATVNITVVLYSPLVTAQELVLLKYFKGNIVRI